MVKGIFWDNDGVLVDTEILYYQASAELLRGVGVELTPVAFAEISLRRGESVFDLAAHLPVAKLAGLRQARDLRYAELLQQTEVRVIAGVKEVLQEFSGRLRMGIVTSSQRRHFDLIHRTTGLRHYFDFILTREDYIQSKPHPEPYLAALARSGLRAQECLVVEDSERGLAAARQAGLRCVVVPGDLNRGSDFSAADHVLKNIRELPPLLFGPALETG